MQTRSMKRIAALNTLSTPPIEFDGVLSTGSNTTVSRIRDLRVSTYITNDECLQMGVYTSPTRSPIPKYEVNIDFDEAHRAWTANKLARPNSCYVYKCEAITKIGNPCVRAVIPNTHYCYLHRRHNTINYTEIVDVTDGMGCCGK